MNYPILKNHNMAYDFESPWIPIQMQSIGKSKSAEISSLQIFWDNVGGTLDGFINVFVSNSILSKSLLVTYSINSSSNINNSIIIEINPIYTFIKINFIKNQIDSGQLNVIANLRNQK